MSHQQNRALFFAASFLLGFFFILLLNIIPIPEKVAEFLVDKKDGSINPFAIQNFIWICFFVGLGEIVLRYLNARLEESQLHHQILPTNPEVLYRPKDLHPYYKKLRQLDSTLFFPRIAMRIILQFQSSGKVGQAHTVMNSSLELMQHELDLRYNYIRYIVWLLPSLGFIGTVLGISNALNTAGAADINDPNLLEIVTADLGVAFYTTLLALILSSILLFIVHYVQGKEETILNEIGQFTMDHLVNKLYEKN